MSRLFNLLIGIILTGLCILHFRNREYIHGAFDATLSFLNLFIFFHETEHEAKKRSNQYRNLE